MENYTTEKTTIDGHVIEGIEMLDNDTCCLYFEDETEGDNIITTTVEYWADEDSWHFIDNIYDLDGTFLDHCDTERLTEEGKTKVMEYMKGLCVCRENFVPLH